MGVHSQSITALLCHYFFLTFLSAPVWDIHGQQLLQKQSKCSSVGSPTGCGVDISSGVVLHRLQWHLCSGAWSTSSPASSLALVFTLLVHSPFFTLLFWGLILPFLKYVTTEVYNIVAAGASWNQLCPASPHRGHPAPALRHVHLFFPSFPFLSVPFPLFLLFHLLSSLTISSLFLFSLSHSSLSHSPHSLLPSPLSLHPIISNSDKRIILLLKQKYKTIINIFMKQEQLKSLSFLIFFFISIQNKESVSYSFLQKSREISTAFLSCFFSPFSIRGWVLTEGI